LGADRNRTHQANCINSDGRILHGHQGCRRSVPERKASEGRAPPPVIRDSAQSDRSQEKTEEGNGRERGLVGQMEETVRSYMEDAVSNETWTDEGCHEEFIELEEAPKRQ
jgi:hypothetical protein